LFFQAHIVTLSFQIAYQRVMRIVFFILFVACQGMVSAQSLEEYFPLRLFFANDEPNPKSVATTTNLTYTETYKSYEQKFSEYQQQGEYFDVLLENEIIANYNKLKGLKQTLVDTLKTGKRIILQVKGFASPLHKTDYNVNISKRRISSFINELKWNDPSITSDDELINYINNGQLIIEELPFGEYAANPDANDQLDSLHLSVYNLTASYERRVEVEQVIVLPKDAPYLAAKTTYHEAGKIAKGQKITTTFTLENQSENDLKIDRIAVSCGCSVVDIENMLLKSGEHTILKVEIDTNELSIGKATKSITVFYNNGLAKRFVVLLEVE
jgi:hypothetical protein